MIILIIFIFSQAFILFCCASLGSHDPEADAYEEQAQDDYVKAWNKKHREKH